MEKRRIWTKEDEQYLIDNYSALGKNCAQILNRSEQAIFAKASKLGIKSKAERPKQAKTNDTIDQELLNFPLFRVDNYIDNRTPITFECFEGHQWKTSPTHVLAGSRCPRCEGNIKRTTEEYRKLVPFDVLEDYINKETPILHKCSEGHIWKGRPGHIIRGSGCPTCNPGGFDKAKPGILYYVKIIKDNETYYKIGITNNSVQERFKADSDKEIISLKETYFEIGEDAEIAERVILDEHDSSRQNIKGFLKSRGNTELFEVDILGLDNDN